ncbi:TPA: suppressor of fused domain protein [Vibrio vulnificus]|nr:suppressor of fused domain protein [Vibrio vulnificus]
MSLVQHVENYLGTIDRGWKDHQSENNLQIVSFVDCPGETVSTFVSLGMSTEELKMGDSRTVRQEIVFSAYTIFNSNLIVSFLISLCEGILGRGKAVLRGEVIPLSPELAQKIGFEFVYCTIPIFFEDDFRIYDETSPSTVMVWVLPIYRSEADYIGRKGWERFEDLLEEKDPDLCLLGRESIT